MATGPVSRQIQELFPVFGPAFEFFVRSDTQVREAGDLACDFRAGNPQELPLEAYGEALRRATEATRRDWYAYIMSDPDAQALVAKSLRERFGIPFEPTDIVMTNAAIGGLAVILRALCDPGDEVVIVVPPHFLYEPLIRAAGAAPVRVGVRPTDFDLDLDALAGAITERTRAVIVNSPHNPTGKIFPPETLERLGSLLAEASARHGRPLYLLSDEAYNRIIFDGRPFSTPTAFYPRSFLVYTYGKQLLAPGQRIGYIALPPGMPDKELILGAITTAQLVSGWAFPNALLQHAMADLEPLSIDIDHLQEKRDRMVEGFRELGYELHVPEATFYLMVRSPIEDDVAFMRRLADRNVFVLPGSMLEQPGYFRISLTASDDMIERSWPGFRQAIEETK